jgi:hypothetical protein
MSLRCVASRLSPRSIRFRTQQLLRQQVLIHEATAARGCVEKIENALCVRTAEFRTLAEHPERGSSAWRARNETIKKVAV